MILRIVLALFFAETVPAESGTVAAQKGKSKAARHASIDKDALKRGVRNCTDATEQALRARKAWDEACLPRREDLACTEWPGAEGTVSRQLSDANGDCLVCRDESAALYCLKITHVPY